MKWWHLITILFGLAAVFLVVIWKPVIDFSGIWSSDHQTKKRSDVKKVPNVKTIREDMAELRQRNHLRSLTTMEDGKPVQELPNGIYGFSACGATMLSAKPGNTFSLEIHKHHDGIVYYVGYASDEHIQKYLAREKNFHILMSPRSWERASSLLEIPVEFITKCEGRAVRDGYLFDLFVTAIPELQS